MASGPGSTDEFRRFYDRHYWTVVEFVSRRVASAHDVDELVNSVFTIAWHKRGDIPAEPRDREWLLLVARHKVANFQRGIGRWEKLIDRLSRIRNPAASATVDDVAVVNDVAIRALKTLRSTHREVLMLIAWDGLNYAEAAAVLGCSTNVFGVRLHRARQAFARAYEEECRLAGFDDLAELDETLSASSPDSGVSGDE